MSFRNKNTALFSVLLVSFLIMAGCVQEINIKSDGLPVPENVVKLTNPETGIEITYMFVRTYKKYEGKEYLLLPDYLPVETPQNINPYDTENLQIHISVYNPNKVRYEMWEDYSFSYEGSRWPTHMQKCFYDGSLSVKSFIVKLPVKGDQSLKKVVAAMKMRGNSGRFTIVMGPAIYELNKGE